MLKLKYSHKFKMFLLKDFDNEVKIYIDSYGVIYFCDKIKSPDNIICLNLHYTEFNIVSDIIKKALH